MEETLDDWIKIIENHPTQAKQMYNKVLDLSLLDTPIREGAWTPRQIFHHLVDSHLNSYIRIKLALTEDEPTIKPYNEKEWAQLPDNEVPIPVSLQILEGIHHRISIILKSMLREERLFERKFTHPESGKMSIKLYVKIFSDHGVSHLNGIAKLISNH